MEFEWKAWPEVVSQVAAIARLAYEKYRSLWHIPTTYTNEMCLESKS